MLFKLREEKKCSHISQRLDEKSEQVNTLGAYSEKTKTKSVEIHHLCKTNPPPERAIFKVFKVQQATINSCIESLGFKRRKKKPETNLS